MATSDVSPATSEASSQAAAALGRGTWAAQVRRALNHLDDATREVLELSYFANLTQPEIADRLGVSLINVRRAAARGLRTLAQGLDAAPAS